MTKIVVAAIAATVLSFCATAALAQMAEPAQVSDTSKGKTLVDAKGMTLYVLDRDKGDGKSTCNGQCATNWPPFMASGDAMNMGSGPSSPVTTAPSSGPIRASRSTTGRTIRRRETLTGMAATAFGISPRPECKTPVRKLIIGESTPSLCEKGCH